MIMMMVKIMKITMMKRMTPVMTMMMTGTVGESDGEHSDGDLYFSRQGGGSSGDWGGQVGLVIIIVIITIVVIIVFVIVTLFITIVLIAIIVIVIIFIISKNLP